MTTEMHEMKAVKSKEIEMTQQPLDTKTVTGGNHYYPSSPTKLGKMSAVKTKIIEMMQSPIPAGDGKN